ncbi:FAD binding domain-containing protein [Treponema putidum]|uniref:FAD-binding protein n=1 Tax=Treponema putidum TaxID=221027 RepID=A0AAE9MSY1_9SPIR|nr:FAD binding domain-containing protein [Treponema putidum]AIN93747.1 FAD-binding protein [Treponema putidum]TWI77851.1 CO/xanthine dehydrogenase FAD-binding subunit [Treponema putidum]UTY27691.1 FAD-binding protein [Treponema putidum]UTY32607.1 FAD-binding protein [Treponema putidum]
MSELTKNSIIYRARHMQEMLSILKNISNVRPIGGSTGFLNYQTDEIVDLPAHVLDVNFLPELKIISKTERYFEFGAAVTLNEILDLGKKNIPPSLYYSIEKIANNSIRSLATIGGNIAAANPLAGTFLPMLALDAKLEIRTAEDIEWVPFAKYIDKSYAEKRAGQYIISRIRIPNETWTKSFYTRLGTPGYIDSDTASFLFLILVQKDILSDMRLFFASDKLVRNKEFDNLLLGRTLPISHGEVPLIMQKAKQFFTREEFSSDFHNSCFYNLLEDNLYKLT